MLSHEDCKGILIAYLETVEALDGAEAGEIAGVDSVSARNIRISGTYNYIIFHVDFDTLSN